MATHQTVEQMDRQSDNCPESIPGAVRGAELAKGWIKTIKDSKQAANANLMAMNNAIGSSTFAVLLSTLPKFKNEMARLANQVAPFAEIHSRMTRQYAGIGATLADQLRTAITTIQPYAKDRDNPIGSLIGDSVYRFVNDLRICREQIALPTHGLPTVLVDPPHDFPIGQYTHQSDGTHEPAVGSSADQLHQLTDFAHGPDYRCVRSHGAVYTLSSREAEIIQMLHEVHENGTPDLGQDYIIQEICGSRSNVKRLRDLFSDRDIWEALISPGDRRGTFRLDM